MCETFGTVDLLCFLCQPQSAQCS